MKANIRITTDLTCETTLPHLFEIEQISHRWYLLKWRERERKEVAIAK